MAKRTPLITLNMVTLEAQGNTPDRISMICGVSLAAVHSVLNSSDAKIIRRQLEQRTLDTHADVQVEMQARAPEMVKILADLATDLGSPPAVRARAAVDYLKFAGHSPIQQVEVRNSRNQTDHDFTDMTEDEIRSKLFEDLDDGQPRRLLGPAKDKLH